MKQVTGTVEATVKDGLTGAEKSEKAPVTYPEFENSDDVLTYLSGSGTEAEVKTRLEEFLKAVNYGFNLGARSTVRQTLMAKLEGPDKAINKLVNDIVKARGAAGMPITEPDARKLAIAMLGIAPAPTETAATT